MTVDRKKYWNEEYTKYWKEATKEADEKGNIISNMGKEHNGDFKTPGEKNIEKIFSLVNYVKNDKLLDYGCGFGRFFPFFSCKVDYFGIDISESMIDECKMRWPNEAKRFIVAEGEQLPFENEYFDKIVCYGVFDCCYQEQALFEMMRVLKKSGLLIITGKNINYYDDDDQAFIAEEAARKKNHPNYFTNVTKMKEILGSNIQQERFYLYRGDFAKGIYADKQPEKFYEWCLIIEKTHNYSKHFNSFSNEYSNTWRSKTGQGGN